MDITRYIEEQQAMKLKEYLKLQEKSFLTPKENRELLYGYEWEVVNEEKSKDPIDKLLDKLEKL